MSSLKPTQAPIRLLTIFFIVTLFYAAIAPTYAASALESVAHRGDKQFHSDNTIEGIRSAVDKGADWVEFDVIYNPEGDVFFLSHDNWCSGPGGSTFIDSASAETVRSRCDLPELVEVLTIFNAQGYVNFVVEFKNTPSTTTSGASALSRILESEQANDDVYVSSLSDSALMTLRSEDDALKLMRVRATSGAIKVTRRYIDETQDMGMQAINVNLWAWSPELVEYARSQGLITSGWAWPSADESTNTDAIELDLDMWMTDRLDDLHSKLGR